MAALILLVPLVSAAGADVTLSASALTFADRPVGTTADAQQVRLTNSGDAPLTISTVHIDGPDAADFGQSAVCPINPDTVPVGGSCTIYVSFTPQGAGPRSATLSIGDDAASSPQTVALSGGGILAPQASLSPGALAFGGVQVGDHSAAQTVTLTNTGSATLTLSSIGLAGANAGDFTRTTTCDLNAGVPAGGSCTVDVVFAPQSAGDKTATLTFDDNAAGTPQSVTLTGTATPVPVPSVGLSPTTLAFGSGTVGATSPGQPVSITNTGGAPLTISSIDATPDFAVKSNCPLAPATLAADASCTATVTFAPSATGARNGTLTVTDDAAGSPQRVSLSGIGLAPGTYFSDDFESGSLDQWNVLSSSDSTAALDATIANSGGSSVRLTNNTGDQSSRLDAKLAGGGHAQSYTRFCFRIAPGLTQGIEIANGRAVTAAYPLGIRRWEVLYNPVTKGLDGYFWNDALQRMDLYAAAGRVLLGDWHCAELYLDESTNGRAELWLDGTSVGSVTGDLGTPDPYDSLYLWNQPSAGSIWFDDVKVADKLSGPVGAALASRPPAQVDLSPSSIKFGAQPTNTATAAQTVTLTNTGGSPLTIGGIAASADFGQSNNCPLAPATLGAGASCAISVTFTPSATGPRTGSLTVTDDAAGSPQTVALSGTGLVPGTYLSDDFESGSLAQWDVLSSSDSAVALDATVANAGGSSVRVTNNTGDQYSRLMADLAGGGHAQSYTRFCFRIAPGLSQGIEIANGRAVTADQPLGIRRWEIIYSPVTHGLEGYFWNDALQRLDLYAADGRVLTGRWYCAELFLDESTSGHAQLWLDGVSVGSVSGDLGTPDPYSRLYLWNQSSAGTVWFDDVRVADAQSGPVGAGAADLPGPQVSLSPASLAFGSQTTQTTSAGQSVTLTNSGATPLTVTSIGLTGTDAGDFAQTNNCPATLGAGASCTATVTFTPTATGARTASLSITDDASGTPHTVALSGTGAAPAAAVATLSPTSVSFGDQQVGTSSAAQTVTLTNTGTLPMSISEITIGGPNAGDFSRTTTCPTGSTTLAAGGSCTIAVTLTPSASGSRTSTLTIASNAVNSPANVGLAGNGTLPPGTLFTDGFENGLVQWQTVGNGSATTGPGGRSGNDAQLSNAQPSIGIYADFAGQGQPETHTRFCFQSSMQFGSILAQGRDANGATLWEIDYDPGIRGLDIYVWDASHTRIDRSVSNLFTVSGQWYCADVDFAQAVAGHFTLTVDGTQIASATADFSAASNYSRLMFWNASADGTLILDDVSVTVS